MVKQNIKILKIKDKYFFLLILKYKNFIFYYLFKIKIAVKFFKTKD